MSNGMQRALLTAAAAALAPAARRRRPRLRAASQRRRPENRQVTIDGAQYTLAAVCKTHDCAEHNIFVLYRAATGTVLGQVQQKGRKTLLGNPSPAMAKEIDRLWTKAFRGRT